MQYIYEGCMLGESPFTQIGQDKIIEATRPSDSTPCSTETLTKKDMGLTITPYGAKKVDMFKQIVTGQFFTPSIYKNAVASHKGLKLIDSYFMDSQGHRHDKFCSGNLFACAIVEKITH